MLTVKEKLKKIIIQADKFIFRRRLSRMRAMKTYPNFITFDVSGWCNLNCTICSLKEWFPESVTKLVSNEVVDRIVAYAKHIKHITLQCNCEPLLNPNAHLIVRSFKAANPSMTVAMVTNGTLLSKERCEKLIESGIDEITVSIDGATKDSYEAVRKGAQFEKVIENIRSFNQLRNRPGKKRPRFCIITVLTMANLPELYEILTLAITLGADHFSINGLEAYTEEQNRNIIYRRKINTDAKKIFKRLRSLARKSKVTLSLPSLKLRSQKYCIRSGVTIDTNGNVFPCASLSYERPFYKDNVKQMHPRICMGNLKDSSLYDIIFSTSYVAYRKNLLSGNLPLYCRDCLIKDDVICS